MKKADLYSRVFSYFSSEQPLVDTELDYGSVFQLLVAVILSAQCTDKRVNMVTPALFAAYPDAKSIAVAEESEVYEYVKSVSYPNAKAKHIIQMSQMLLKDFDGEVPSDMDSLTRLPGVGRKTANVIMAVAFRKEAMPVDTHVFRVSHRLGLVPLQCTTPYKVEQELMKNIRTLSISVQLADAHHWLLLHGRYVCKSAKPLCNKCPFDTFCPKRMEGSKL